MAWIPLGPITATPTALRSEQKLSSSVQGEVELCVAMATFPRKRFHSAGGVLKVGVGGGGSLAFVISYHTVVWRPMKEDAQTSLHPS